MTRLLVYVCRVHSGTLDHPSFLLSEYLNFRSKASDIHCVLVCVIPQGVIEALLMTYRHDSSFSGALVTKVEQDYKPCARNLFKSVSMMQRTGTSL